MRLKQLAAAVLSVAVVCSLAVPAAAAVTNPTLNIESLTGAPIDEDGVQYADMGTTVIPGQTIYFLLPGGSGKIFGNTDQVRVSVRKTRNSKYIDTVTVADKRLVSGTGSYTVPSGVTDPNYFNTNAVPKSGRNTYLAVKLKDYTGADEIKVEMDVSFTVRKSSATGYGFTYGTGTSVVKDANNTAIPATVGNPSVVDNANFKTSGDKLTLRAAFYIGNKQDSGEDVTISVGGAGKTVKPVANTENVINFDTSSDTIATLTFQASSNPSKFLARLSNTWTTTLLNKFKNTDAVIWRFSAANVDSSSRALLALKNPFDPDDVDPRNVYVYSVSASGVISNVTSSFTYDEDEDTFSTKVRSLGTYIISDKKVKV